MHHPNPARRRRHGVTLVEAAFVLAIALLFLMGLLEYSRYLMVLHVADNAAREGAHYAAVHTGDGTQLSDVINYVNASMASVDTQITGYTVNVFTVDMSSVYNTSTNQYLYPSSPNLSAKANSNWNDAQFGNALAVTITGTYQPILPSLLFLSTSLPINVTSTANSEAN
jgi:Flp pilus assembly protein TadG